MIALENSHTILVSGIDLDHCQKRILRFLNKTVLVNYDRIEIVYEECVRGDDNSFFEMLDSAILKNKAVILELITELEDSGINSLRDFLLVSEGYQSKIFHTLAHLLDGFFGIDSVFYNLEDDSKGVSDILRKTIIQDPSKYWLIELRAFSESVAKASLIHSAPQ